MLEVLQLKRISIITRKKRSEIKYDCCKEIHLRHTIGNILFMRNAINHAADFLTQKNQYDYHVLKMCKLHNFATYIYNDILSLIEYTI